MTMTNATDGRALIDLARAALDAAVRRRAAPDPPPTPLFQRRAGAFVTLRKLHELRGCIGQPEPHDPLGSVIVHCAAAAALEDPRFPPVDVAELPSIAVEISVLTPLVKVSDPEAVEVGRHGLVIARGGRRGLLLPQVPTEWHWSREEFLDQTCRKAGLPRDAWRHGADVFSFEAEIFDEEALQKRPTLCPACGQAMRSLTLDAHYGEQVTIDLCGECHGFWFDGMEHLRLAASATLSLFEIIDAERGERHSLPDRQTCPRCRLTLRATEDRQRSTTFHYWRCPSGDGRFMTFVDFLREKDFVRPLDEKQLADLRARMQSIKCSNCGAMLDLNKDTVCGYCRTPLMMIDFEQVGKVVQQLREEASRPAVDPQDLAPVLSLLRDGWQPDGEHEPVEGGLGQVVAILRRMSRS
jgi:AmmeMemoRadiSam system protein A